jgi:hypothetical protein
MCTVVCIKIAFELAAKFSRRGENPVPQREKRNFQTAQNGVFPSVAILAGQLKRNQLYFVCNTSRSWSCELRRPKIAMNMFEMNGSPEVHDLDASMSLPHTCMYMCTCAITFMRGIYASNIYSLDAT